MRRPKGQWEQPCGPILRDMPEPEPMPSREMPGFWAQWGLVLAVVVCLLVGLIFLQAQRIGSPTAPLPRDHVALTWDSWIFLAPPPPGTKPNPIAPPQGTSGGQVAIDPADLELLAAIQGLVPAGAALEIMPDPFDRDRAPTVPTVWEPLAQLRKARQPTQPLVIFRRGEIPLSPFQQALSWSDPGGLVIVVDIRDLGTDPALMRSRLRRLLRHEYGHLAGCQHRDGCVMTAVKTMAEVDRLSDAFCPPCDANVAALPFAVPGQRDPLVRRVNPITGQER